MLVLSATYMSNLRHLIERDKLEELFIRTIKFLWLSKNVSPTLQRDALILAGIYHKIFNKTPQTSFTEWFFLINLSSPFYVCLFLIKYRFATLLWEGCVSFYGEVDCLWCFLSMHFSGLEACVQPIFCFNALFIAYACLLSLERWLSRCSLRHAGTLPILSCIGVYARKVVAGHFCCVFSGYLEFLDILYYF